MASLHTGSDELVYIQTDKVSVTIKGPASHPHNQGAEHLEQESFLKVFCDESYEINLKGDAELVSKQVIGAACLGEYRTVPLFYEQQRYEIVIESFGSSPVEFWHENYNVRNKVTSVGRSEKILSGVINFGNEIGMSDLIVRVNGTDYLRLVIEVFPSKISYKNDYKTIVADVAAEVYNVIFDLLKKTYLPLCVIEDIGCGMSPIDLDKAFLSVGTNNKVDQADTLGEKGIGRLSTQRLGKKVIVETVSNNTLSILRLDWDKIRFLYKGIIINHNKNRANLH